MSGSATNDPIRTPCRQPEATGQLDQQIAACEILAAKLILADDERECVAVNLKFRQQPRERVEKLLEKLA